MFPSHRRWTLVLAALTCLALVLGCSLPGRLLGELPGNTPAPDTPGSEIPPTPGEVRAPEPLVVTHQESSFNVYSLDGALVDTLPASGLAYPRPNTAQVVGEAIYYVDSGGSSLGGVVRRATSAGVETLEFTSAEPQASLTFAVSDDDRRIAWTHTTFDSAGVSSQLYMADIDGGDSQLIVESDPADSLAEYFALEAMRWMDGGDLIYAWQVTGIGGYILFFGWSSLYRYSPADGVSTPLVPATEDGSGPCWYGLSPDGDYAAGGCGEDGMRERELASGTDTAFEVLPDQGQQGAAAYSPSGERLAYAIARGNPDDEGGQVLLRLRRGEAPAAIASEAPGYFYRILWADEDRMAVGYSAGGNEAVDLLNVDGTRSPIGDGALIGLMRPPATTATTAAPGLAELVDQGELDLEQVTSTGEIAGPGIEVQVRNPGPTDVTATLPCGFIFQPEDDSDQRLMVVQEASAAVPAGGVATLTAYVVCIDSNAQTPEEGAGYALGTMQSGSLLQLAQCACGENLDDSLNPFEGLGLMTAGWMISDGKSFDDMKSGESVGAMDQIFGEEGSQLIAGIVEMMEQPAKGWFDRCGIPMP